MPEEDLAGEAWDPEGNHVIITTAVWRYKVLKDHPEVSAYLKEVLRAIYSPDHMTPDLDFRDRRLHFLRGAGPSRWLFVVLSYEQEPARLISAYPRRKDPDSWKK
jgi:hypothetical protein